MGEPLLDPQQALPIPELQCIPPIALCLRLKLLDPPIYLNHNTHIDCTMRLVKDQPVPFPEQQHGRRA